MQMHMNRYSERFCESIPVKVKENRKHSKNVGESGDTFPILVKSIDAAEDAAVMYTMMGCCKIAGVNVEDWLTYFLEHVHEYDNDYSRDLAELLPHALEAKGLLKKS